MTQTEDTATTDEGCEATEAPAPYEVPRIPDAVKNDGAFLDLAFVFANDVRVLYEYGTAAHHDDYGMLQTASVVRRMLLDRQATAPRLAKQIGMKLWFPRYVPFGKETETKFSDLPAVYRVCAPAPRQGGEATKSVWEVHDLTGYLKVSLGVLAKHEVTPELLVKLLANKLGGVHFDRKFMDGRSDDDARLARIFHVGASFKFGEVKILSMFMDKVVFDVFHACNPLLRALVTNDIVYETIAPQKNE